jgi:hypothetical protein
VRDHTTGYADLVSHLSAYPPERTCAETGIDRAGLERVARLIGTGARVSLWWTMGVNQSHEGTRTAQAIINLALLTGNIGRPGTGANSITGQCNAMGSRLFSNTTNLLGGHDFANPDHRAKVAGILGHRRRRHPRRTQLGLRPHHRGHQPGRDPRPLDHRHQLGPLLDQPGRGASPARQARLPGGAGPLHHHRDRRAGRPGAACSRLGREGGHVHQLRAPSRAGEAGGPRARSGPGRLLDLPGRGRRVGLWRAVRPLDRPRGGVRPPPGAQRRPTVRPHGCARLRGGGLGRGAVALPGRGPQAWRWGAWRGGRGRRPWTFTSSGGSSRRCPRAGPARR